MPGMSRPGGRPGGGQDKYAGTGMPASWWEATEGYANRGTPEQMRRQNEFYYSPEEQMRRSGWIMGPRGEWIRDPSKMWGRGRSSGIGGGYRSAGPVRSTSSRGPTGPWGRSNPIRTGGELSPALMQLLGGGGSEEELMALLQQLGIGG